MKIDPKVTIKQHSAELEKIFQQRRMWLFASSIVYAAIIIGIAGWEYVDSYSSKHTWWAAVSVGLLISVNWWYWTMRSISSLIRSIYSEFEILSDVTNEISEIKTILECKKVTTEDCMMCPVKNGCSGKKK